MHNKVSSAIFCQSRRVIRQDEEGKEEVHLQHEAAVEAGQLPHIRLQSATQNVIVSRQLGTAESFDCGLLSRYC